MKKLACFLLVTVLISCQKEILPPIEGKPVTTANKNGTIHDVHTYDFTGTQIPNPCTGMILTATMWKTTITTNTTITGNKATIGTHVSSQFKFTDTAGRTYTGINSTFTNRTELFTDTIITLKVSTHQHINTAGDKNNVVFVETYTLEISQGGIINYKRDPNSEFRCQ